MLLVFLDGQLAGVPDSRLRASAQLGEPIEAYGTFHGAMTTWHLPEPGMTGVTKLVELHEYEAK